jgi:TolA protein
MDRAEQIGLGSAVGGHALLAAALAFGLFNAADIVKPPEPITVELVGEDALLDTPDSAAPAIASPLPEEMAAGEPAPPDNSAELAEAQAAEQAAQAAAAEAAADRQAEADAANAAAQKKAEAEAASQAAAKAKADAAKVSATAAEKQRAREAAAKAEQAKRDANAAEQRKKQQAEQSRKAAAERLAKAEAAKKQAAAAAKARAEAAKKQATELAKRQAAIDAKNKANAAAAKEKARKEKAARDKALADAVNGVGKDNKPNVANVAATKKAKAKIGGQISIGCILDAVDVEKIITTVTIQLNQNGTIQALSNVTQAGRTDSNASQLGPVKNCVLQSIRKAAPFRGLEVDDYESWKSIRIGFKKS